MTDMGLVLSIAFGGNAILALFRPRPDRAFLESLGDRVRDAVLLPLGCAAGAFIIAGATGAAPTGLANPPSLFVYAFTGAHGLVFGMVVAGRLRAARANREERAAEARAAAEWRAANPNVPDFFARPASASTEPDEVTDHTASGRTDRTTSTRMEWGTTSRPCHDAHSQMVIGREARGAHKRGA